VSPQDFAYWLQGYAEFHEGLPSEKQWQMIKDHLQTVFNKVTPDRGKGGGGSGQDNKLAEELLKRRSHWPRTTTIC
jgi:hypothetical protein